MCWNFEISAQVVLRRFPQKAKIPLTAVTGLFRSFLHREHSRWCPSKSHITAVCGPFKSFLPDEAASEEPGIPHHVSVCMVQVLSSKRALPLLGATRDIVCVPVDRQILNQAHNTVA